MDRIAILAALMSATASLMPVPAETAPRHYEVLILVGRRASTINVDLLQAKKAYQTEANINSASMGCLSTLTDTSGEIDSDLGELSDLATLSSLMKSPADARAVDRVMRLRTTAAVHIFGVLRPEISAMMGYCSDSPLIQSKGQVLLDFMQATADQLNDLNPSLDR
jgi:hypothetical protein